MGTERKAKKELNGNQYELMKMPPRKAVVFATKVAQVVANAVGDDLVTLLNRLKSKEPGEIGAVLAKSLGNIDPEKVNDLFDEAMSHQVFYRDGSNPRALSDQMFFDQHFAENPADYFSVAIWATMEHSKDFIIGSFANLSPAEAPEAESQSPESGKPPTS